MKIIRLIKIMTDGLRADTRKAGFPNVPVCLACVVMLVPAGSRAQSWVGGTYSYVDLIGTLTNLERLAQLPLAGEKICRMDFS